MVLRGQKGYPVAYGNGQVVVLQPSYSFFDVVDPDLLFRLASFTVLRFYLPVDGIVVPACNDQLGAVRSVSRAGWRSAS
ncbi:hypothetical protein [Methanothrix sp.]|uniref:hypothetical protein n=1 Tax=Methanothrix sp. TaxID=90426 RepID=UPI001BD40294